MDGRGQHLLGPAAEGDTAFFFSDSYVGEYPTLSGDGTVTTNANGLRTRAPNCRAPLCNPPTNLYHAHESVTARKWISNGTKVPCSCMCRADTLPRMKKCVSIEDIKRSPEWRAKHQKAAQDPERLERISQGVSVAMADHSFNKQDEDATGAAMDRPEVAKAIVAGRRRELPEDLIVELYKRGWLLSEIALHVDTGMRPKAKGPRIKHICNILLRAGAYGKAVLRKRLAELSPQR